MLLAIIFVIPVLLDLDIIHPQALHISLMLIYLAGIWSARHKAILIFAIACFTASLALNIADLISDTPLFKALLWVTYSLNTLAFIITNIDLLFRDDRFNFHRVIGAVNVYLLFALLGGLLLELIDYSFGVSLKGDLQLGGPDENFGDYIYFSMMSLTTLGMGDIQPAHSIVRMLSVFLSTIGVLFPAVIIARLVSAVTQK